MTSHNDSTVSFKDWTKAFFELIRSDNVMETIQIFLQGGVAVHIDARDSEGFTPLLLACSRRQESVVQLLIEYGVNVDVKCSLRGYTVLHYASEFGWTNLVRSLVQKVSDMNAVAFGGRTALHCASSSGFLDVVKCLVSEGADMDRKDIHDHTPLLCAAETSKRDVVDFLLASRANGDMGKLLFQASTNGWSDMMHSLVKRVPDLNKCYPFGLNALHVASFKGHLETVKCLVKEGADVNSKTALCGQTALQFASIEGHFEVVKWLVEETADINSIRCEDESTLLHDASQNGTIEVVHSVVKRNCDLNARDKSGMTALAGACWRRKFKVIQYLLQAGASWKIADSRDITPLKIITMVIEPEFEIIKIFIENGAYLDILDCNKLVESSSNVLQDVKLCCQTIVNQFNNHDLPELYELPVSGSLPRIEKMKIASDSEVAQSIKRTVEFEIQGKGHCNIFKVRPMALSQISVRSLLKYYEKKKSGTCNGVKRPAAFESNSEFQHPNKILCRR